MQYFILLFCLLNFQLFAASLDVEVTTQETMFIYLFTLGVIVLFILLFSVKQIRKLKQDQRKMYTQQEDLEKKQEDLLVEMSKNFLSITEEVINNTSKSVNLDEKEVRSKLSKVINTENTLLDVTGDLIEFLKLKSKKVKILKNNFKLENLLNDILGQTSVNYKNSNIELIFAVDDNIPDTLQNDTLNISKILVTLIDFCILNKSKQIVLQVSKRNRFNAEATLHFMLYTDMKLEINNDIFNTVYNEKTKKYDGISLFVAKELSLLLGGNIIARNSNKSTAEFVLTLPYYKVNNKTLQEDKLDTKILTEKKILVIDSFHQSTLAIRTILQKLKLQVDINTKEEYLNKLPNFSNYDTIILDEKLVTEQTVQEITSIKKTAHLNVIILTNVFSKEKEIKLDGLKLKKPLTKESVYYTLLNNQYIIKDSISDMKIKSQQKLKVQRERFKDTPNITLSNFSDFAGTELLIVEDNIINQKVLISMLMKSKINITVANDGQEAINILYSKKQFDMVLMDINMPVMDGYLATLKIRKKSALDNTPIVALSALTSADEINKVFHVGMNGYLAKPFSKEKLYTAFDTFMTDKKIISNSQEEPKEITITNLEGLNITKGLEETNGNMIFYTEILKEFIDAYGKSNLAFIELVSDKKFEQAKVLCLDIRGLSGAIGAGELQDLSSEIVQIIALKEFDKLPNYFESFTKVISTLNKSIKQYV